MKKQYVLKIAITLAMATILTACGPNNEGRVIIEESGKKITVIENEGTKPASPSVKAQMIDRYENMVINDWLDDKTVIVSKENTSLGKMKLEELSDRYPTSLYLYDLETGKSTPIKEQENMLLGGAVLSPDKKYLLYYGNTLGDPIFYVMNLETKTEVKLPQAQSARWADDGTIIGASYNGGAYIADPSGKVMPVSGLEGEILYIVEKIRDKVYYNTGADYTLKVLDLKTGQKTSLNLGNVYAVVPSADGNELLVIKDNGATQALILCDADGGNMKTIAEGAEMGGAAWSPDQKMIAFSRKTVTNGTTESHLYIYGRESGEEIQLVVNVESPAVGWSPSGNALNYIRPKDGGIDSSIVVLGKELKE